jgi:hypothetical protein
MSDILSSEKRMNRLTHISRISRRRTNETAHGIFFHILGHIQSNQIPFRSIVGLSERFTVISDKGDV